MPSRLLAHLERRVLVVDGAMGTAIHGMDLDIDRDYLGCENCPEVLLKSRPELIQGIHESFLAVGADAVETDSFGGARHVLAEFGLGGETFEINRLAAEVARAAADRHATAQRPRFVLGSMGPGTKLLTLGQISWDDMLASYREQARGLVAGGADALLIETCQDLLQVKCAVNACLAALADTGKGPEDVPIMVSVTIETTGSMLLGTTIEAAAVALRGYPIASLGLNCATGPVEMADHVQHLCRHWDRHVSVIPNAGLPVLLEGRTEFPLRAAPFAETLSRYVRDLGVSVVGGCCGTTPAHIAELVGLVGGGEPRAREIEPSPGACTSLYSPTEYRQETSFLIVGERMNASGSKRFKELLEAEDWDGIVSLARSQLREGSHVLDLNVDYAGRDNARDAAEIVARVAKQADAPLMIDSTQVKTMEAALKRAPGKCIINSANFEDGEEKFDAICALAKRYGAALVIGTIDEDKEAAMARTAERKLAIALRARERATRVHGLDERDLFFDPLVLPVSTGMEADRRSGLETIEGARRIAAALPRCQMTCGVSNVSFGLKPAARVVLNSVFLHELVGAGLTSAIVHASKILPLNRIPHDQRGAAMDLLYDRRHESVGGTGLPAGVTDTGFDPLQAFIELFKDAGAASAGPAEKKDLTLEERLRAHIVDGEKEGLAACLEQALTKYRALDIINDHLLDGMKTVGELFGSGQMQLPFVLQSAEVMKSAVAYLEPHMDKSATKARGSIVLATVKGDVHDIGKNLVDIILSNNGYTVYNLGIKQPLSNILEKWRETKADAIGLSGLLVKSVHVMEENLRELNGQGLAMPVILGGAALSRHYAEDHLRSVYEGSLYYGKDAFEGLRFMDKLAGAALPELDAEIEQRLSKRSDAERVIAESKARQAAAQEAFIASKAGGAAVAVAPARSDVATDVPVPTPPFWGSRVIEHVDLDEVYPFINTVALFRGQWQFKKGRLSEEEYERRLEETIVPVFERLKQRCRDEQILRPKVVYGYWPCASEGDDLIVYDPAPLAGDAAASAEISPGALREVLRFTFPRQEGKRRLCLSDFFRPVESGRADVLGLQCVSMGARVGELARELFERSEYTEYLYLHGMGVESAEALAELWHKRIRQELGIAVDDSPKIRELFTQHYRGSRYSAGYPACPDMSDHEKIWALLRPERIGCVLTENYQIVPEQSTSAWVVHHPEAKYFNV
ncbi:MAG TPA: methionine synthase [Phycisphaerales bacterium]|nr:methionine synthase [Phycisphaerales bacterium]